MAYAFLQVFANESLLVGGITGLAAGLGAAVAVIRKKKRYDLDNISYLKDLYHQIDE